MTVSLVNFVEKSARLHPDFPAVTCEGRTRCWSEVWQRVQNLAGGLQSLGLKRGEKVAYLGFNTDWFFECYFAPSLAGLELVALNYRLALPELIECLLDCAPTAIICDPTHVNAANLAGKKCSSIQHIITIESEPEIVGAISYEQLLEKKSKPVGAPLAGDDTLIIYYTGGTTGRAKGVMLSHWNLFSNSMGTIPNYGLEPLENYLLAGPMFHSAAGSRVYTSAILSTHMILLPKFDVPTFLGLIEKHKVTATQCVPTMMQMILDHPEFRSFDISSLRMITWGAAPTPHDLLNRIVSTFPKADLFHGYGMTEASPLVTALGPEYHGKNAQKLAKLGSAGKPLAHVDVRIFDENNHEMPAGEIGEIVIRGPNVMKGYLNLSEETAHAMRGDWFHTGDAGYLDSDGFLWISGRKKEMIISGGENIYPVEVENVLSTHPAVAEVAVFGVPDNKWGEAVHAVIVFANGKSCNEEDLISYSKQHLAGYKCPRTVSIRSEPLPLSGANKVLKSILLQEFLES